ncbi:hypothetical protein HYV85_06425 [Candidatus Woesearchaeota archaeon]|nr:hypothetical protein [Candidatus Woesearchaeota archaeon]
MIKKVGGAYVIGIQEQLLDYLGLKEGDEVEFEPKKVFKLAERVTLSEGEARIKLTSTCFNYGVATLSVNDRHLFPHDHNPFLLEIDGKLEKKHVASLKIAMKPFFDRHPELRERKHIMIKVVKPLQEYKLVY